MDVDAMLTDAESIVDDRLLAAPDYTIFQSIKQQIEYIKNIRAGKEGDRSRLSSVNVGLYGVREFEESDPELAYLLKRVQYIADEMRQGEPVNKSV
ncbi:hypothetical protein KUV59_16380 [Marinobacter daepoensis]|uniref:immunity protein Tsi6 family protein n=1 Tax=Marinobacter daepoensis TaxID=262077 RepID=UPI001C9684FB|nr:immunity protein Tsi6 family protein [Marinobacter daepoensis]MBY6034757.1 hypothetical protein [Marinobacter daepoensis]